MATSSVQISAQFAGNKPLKVLSDLIAKRAEYLKGETTENAVTATAINVMKSLRAETKVAPVKADESMYEITLVQANAAGWRHVAGKGFRRSPVIGGHWARDIYPINNMYGLERDGDLYRVRVLNPNFTPGKKAKNSPYYMILAPNRAAVVNTMNRIVRRILKKEAGMAKYAIQKAAAKIYDKSGGEPVKPVGGSSKAFKIAADSAHVTKVGDGFSNGNFELTYHNGLWYSELALKKYKESLLEAFKKAANSTAAIINKMGNVPIDETIQTPFPEIAKSKASK